MIGEYKHFKGNIYTVLDIATHTETEEKLVIYRDKNNNTYARPYDMFFEKVVVDGVKVPRFKKI